MFNLDNITNKNNKNNKNNDKYWPFRILIIGKNNALLNLIQKPNDSNLIDKIYLYAKDLSEDKYQFLIKNYKNAGIKNYNDPNAFIEYSNTIDDAFNNIDDYNPRRRRKVLIAFDDMIADIKKKKEFKQ